MRSSGWTRRLLCHTRRVKLDAHPACTIADPFLLVHDGRLYLFVEEKRRRTNGVIAAYVTADLRAWDYLGVVLQERHHLSFPFVFEEGGAVYMLPEASRSGRVVLYRAARFPYAWEPISTLLEGSYVDCAIHHCGGRYWMLACRGWDELHAFHSTSLAGEWCAHPGNPLIKDASRARNAGALMQCHGRLVRPSQDCSVVYGAHVRLNIVSSIDTESYVEEELGRFVPPNGIEWWNREGCHHVSTAEFAGQRVLATDGRSPDLLANRLLGEWHAMVARLRGLR